MPVPPNARVSAPSPLLPNARASTRSPLPLLTSAEARALGVDVSRAAFVRVRHGVYADAAQVRALRPWERYAVRVHAFLLRHPDTVLCLESAAAVLGLPLFGEPRDIHVFDSERPASRRFGDVCVHTSADPREIVDVAGILVTSPADTAVDLARVLPPAQGLAVADSVISPVQGGSAALGALTERAHGQINRRGRARLAWVLSRADERSESPGESVSRAVIEWCGFETPVLQPVHRYEGFEHRCDFEFRSTRTLGESDGWGKYDLHDPAAAEQHLRNEKRREDRLRRAGHPFARWDLADALRVDPLATALRAALVRVVRSPDRAGLASLRHAPRTLPRARPPHGGA